MECIRLLLIFVCKQKTAYEMRISDWSSDVCSSDLAFFSFISVCYVRFGSPKRRPNSAPLASRPRAVAHQRQPPRPLFACSWPRFLSGRVQRFGSGKPNGIITQKLCRPDPASSGFVAIPGVMSADRKRVGEEKGV